MVTFLDNASDYALIYLIKWKSQAEDCFYDALESEVQWQDSSGNSSLECLP
jgi:hypothetical protein